MSRLQWIQAHAEEQEQGWGMQRMHEDEWHGAEVVMGCRVSVTARDSSCSLPSELFSVDSHDE
jgi:hypothetical protein